MGPVLYAEDSEDDAFLMRRAFTRGNVPNPLVIVPHGRRAIEYLSGDGEYADRVKHPLPAVVLLDVKMPYEGGIEVLEWIRAQPQFQKLPVLMLTSSSQQSDILSAYRHGANGYLVKPTNLDTFRQMVEGVAALAASGDQVTGWIALHGGVSNPTETPHV